MHELDGMFDGPVVVLSSRVDVDALASLPPDEASLVAGAVAKRRDEFATGRKLARAALAQLGSTEVSILQDAMRAPIWPPGFAGSISHCKRKVFAVVGRRRDIGTVGIDVEDRRCLDEELWPSILVDAELALVSALPLSERREVAMIHFSAKESLYKAQYPRSHELMDFADARLELTKLERSADGAALEGTFCGVFLRDVGRLRAGTKVPGRFRQLADGLLVTSAQMTCGAL